MIAPEGEVSEMLLLETNLWPGVVPKRNGKVRDVYDLGDRLLLVATDRISAFDWILPGGIPDKGRILTGLSTFWFGHLGVPHHLITDDVDTMELDLSPHEREALRGRTMLARKVRIVPFECVVRGYLAGSGWKEYRASGSVCGIPLPAGLLEGSPIGPIFTPATKAESGHDENVSLATMADAVGARVAGTLQSRSLDVYQRASEHASKVGLILADTKFEWGFDERSGELLLADEVLTPDSSRYWARDTHRPGGPQPSFDKQFVRDWLETTGWDKSSPPPTMPEQVVAGTRRKYVEAYERLTGHAFPYE